MPTIDLQTIPPNCDLDISDLYHPGQAAKKFSDISQINLRDHRIFDYSPAELKALFHHLPPNVHTVGIVMQLNERELSYITQALPQSVRCLSIVFSVVCGLSDTYYNSKTLSLCDMKPEALLTRLPEWITEVRLINAPFWRAQETGVFMDKKIAWESRSSVSLEKIQHPFLKHQVPAEHIMRRNNKTTVRIDHNNNAIKYDVLCLRLVKTAFNSTAFRMACVFNADLAGDIMSYLQPAGQRIRFSEKQMEGIKESHQRNQGVLKSGRVVLNFSTRGRYKVSLPCQTDLLSPGSKTTAMHTEAPTPVCVDVALQTPLTKTSACQSAPLHPMRATASETQRPIMEVASTQSEDGGQSQGVFVKEAYLRCPDRAAQTDAVTKGWHIETWPADLQPLVQRIKDLHIYGLQLENNGKREGKIAQKLADDLLNCVTQYEQDSRQNPNFKREFTQLLHSQDQHLPSYDNNWKVILMNIAIALTGVGLFCVVGKLIATRGAGFFFSETRAYELRSQAEKGVRQLTMGG